MCPDLLLRTVPLACHGMNDVELHRRPLPPGEAVFFVHGCYDRSMLRVKRLEAGARLPVVAHPGEDLGYDFFALKAWLSLRAQPSSVRTGIAVEARHAAPASRWACWCVTAPRWRRAASPPRRSHRCRLPRRNPGADDESGRSTRGTSGRREDRADDPGSRLDGPGPRD